MRIVKISKFFTSTLYGSNLYNKSLSKSFIYMENNSSGINTWCNIKWKIFPMHDRKWLRNKWVSWSETHWHFINKSFLIEWLNWSLKINHSKISPENGRKRITQQFFIKKFAFFFIHKNNICFIWNSGGSTSW